MKNSRPILLVEDDIVDVMTVKRALRHLQIDNPLVHLKDGKEAFEYLKDESNTKPNIILLDLNIPSMNGFELLKSIKAEERLKSIPVVVMTTSEITQDIDESFNLSVAGYVVKPLDFDQVIKAFGTINKYWSLSELPGDR